MMIREGEPIYAALVRNRSGQDAGEIDYRLNVAAVENLPQGEKQELMETALALVENLRQYCDQPLPPPAHAAKG